MDKVQREYERIKALFVGADEVRLELADGLLWEAAKIRIQLDNLNDIAERSGLVKIDLDNPTRQKELPVSRSLTKTRANYVSYIQRIKSLLDAETDDDDEGLGEYE